MIKRLLILSIAIFAVSGLALSQGIKIVHISDVTTDISGTEVEAVGDPSDSRIYYDMRVINLTGNSIEIRYQRKRAASTGRSDEICDANLCYSATDAMWYQTPATVTVNDEDTSLFKPQIAPDGLETCGVHVYYVVTSGGTVLDSVSVKFRTTNSNCFLDIDEESIENNDFSMYPNPAENILTLENLTGLNGEVIIYDALGKEVLRSLFNSVEHNINISTLKSGLYFVHVLKNGVLSDPKKLIVKK